MGWDVKDGRRYYSRTHKRFGRYIREYIGGGIKGEQAAAEDAAKRAKREQLAQIRRREEAQWQAAEMVLDHVIGGSEWLFKEALVMGGYHRKRGEWRRSNAETGSNQRRKHASR